MAQPGPNFGRTGLAHRVGPILPPLLRIHPILPLLLSLFFCPNNRSSPKKKKKTDPLEKNVCVFYFLLLVRRSPSDHLSLLIVRPSIFLPLCFGLHPPCDYPLRLIVFFLRYIGTLKKINTKTPLKGKGTLTFPKEKG